MLGLTAIAVFAFLRALRHRPFKLAVDRWLLRLPMIGRLIRDVHAARLARTLATMVASGLPMLEGLMLTAGTVRNAVLQAALRDGGPGDPMMLDEGRAVLQYATRRVVNGLEGTP